MKVTASAAELASALALAASLSDDGRTRKHRGARGRASLRSRRRSSRSRRTCWISRSP